MPNFQKPYSLNIRTYIIINCDLLAVVEPFQLMTMDKETGCCSIDCKKEACWRIDIHGEPYMDSYSCDGHLIDLLGYPVHNGVKVGEGKPFILTRT